MICSAPAPVPACPPLQLARQSHGQLSFRSHGDGEGIVFLDGLPGSSKSWAFQFEHLSRNYRMIAWDAPGFGPSEMVPASIDAYVEALREFVANIGQPKVSLVGHSMGGTVAARFAATFPDLVLRLVLSCSHTGYGEPETAPMSAKFHRSAEPRQQTGSCQITELRPNVILAGGRPRPFRASSQISGDFSDRVVKQLPPGSQALPLLLDQTGHGFHLPPISSTPAGRGTTPRRARAGTPG